MTELTFEAVLDEVKTVWTSKVAEIRDRLTARDLEEAEACLYQLAVIRFRERVGSGEVDERARRHAEAAVENWASVATSIAGEAANDLLEKMGEVAKELGGQVLQVALRGLGL